MGIEGKVKWYSVSKGYGFIAPDEGGRDIFVHADAIKASKVQGVLDEGDKVSFDTEDAPSGKGPRAINISRL
jgi:CspA family cold shock protein